VSYLAGSTSCCPCRDKSRQTFHTSTWLATRSAASRSIIAAAVIVELESVLQSSAQAASGYGSPDRAKVARVNCGGNVRVVRDDVLLVRWLVQRARFLLQKPRTG
jgi:hypothetical protein